VVNRVTPTLVARIMNFGAAFYWLGLRFFYLGLPFLMWLFNHWAMLITGIFLIVAMLWFDDPGIRHTHAYKQSLPSPALIRKELEGSGINGGAQSSSISVPMTQVSRRTVPGPLSEPIKVTGPF
jgi:hypothetical protein